MTNPSTAPRFTLTTRGTVTTGLTRDALRVALPTGLTRTDLFTVSRLEIGSRYDGRAVDPTTDEAFAWSVTRDEDAKTAAHWMGLACACDDAANRTTDRASLDRSVATCLANARAARQIERAVRA